MAHLSSALRQAIRDADPHKLQDIVVELCSTNPQSRSFVERTLLSRGGTSATYFPQTAASYGGNGFMDRGEPLRPEDSRSQVKQDEREEEAHRRNLQCQNCGRFFDPANNDNDSCHRHPGKQSYIDGSAANWPGRSEKLWSKPVSLEHVSRFASGFVWACCLRPLNSEGCLRTQHMLPTVPRERADYFLRPRVGLPMGPLQHPEAVSGKIGDGGHKLPLEESELFKSALKRAAEEAGDMSGPFRKIKLEDATYHRSWEDYAETETTMGEVGELGPSRKKVKWEDGTYLGREEVSTAERALGEWDESRSSGKRIKLEGGTYIKREEVVETAYADDGHRRRKHRAPRRLGMTPQMKNTKADDGPYVKREEGF